MAAVVEIRSFHGASPDSGTVVSLGTLRFKVADNSTVDANNPIPIPGAGTNYSFIKQLRLVCTTTPSNLLNNLKFFTDGTNGFGTGVTLNGRINTPTTGTASSGSTTTLVVAGTPWTTNQFQNFTCRITAGTNSGQRRTILSNTNNTLTFASAFPSSIDNTSVFEIFYMDPTTQSTTVLSSTTNAFSWTSGSPAALAGSLASPSTGEFGDYVVLQMGVGSLASPGSTGTEVLTFQYDES